MDLDLNEFPGDIDINALGQAIDTTWGRSSTPLSAQYSVKMKMIGNCLQVNFGTIVNIGSTHEMTEMKRRYDYEATSVINDAMKKVKKEYKDLSGKSLKTKEIGSEDGLDIIGLAVHNPTRRAIYRRSVLFELG